MRLTSSILLVLATLFVGCDCPNSSRQPIEPEVLDRSLTSIETSSPSPADIVDVVDQLADLIQQRLALMPDVARYKWNHQRPVTDPERETALLASLIAKATEQGISAALAERFFTAQIAAASALQQRVIDELESTGAKPPIAGPDLDKELRPKITALSESLLKPLAIIEPLLHHSATTEYLANALKHRVDATPELGDSLQIAFQPVLNAGRSEE